MERTVQSWEEPWEEGAVEPREERDERPSIPSFFQILRGLRARQ